MRNRRVLAVLAAWLLASSVAVQAADAKADKPAQRPDAQQNKTMARDKNKNTTITSETDSASCKLKSNDSAIRINTGEAALQVGSETQEEITRTNNTSSEENLTLPAPSREEFALDQTRLSSEAAVTEQSQKYKSDNSKTSVDLKCTPKEAENKNSSPASN